MAFQKVLSVLPGLFCMDFLIYLRVGDTSFSHTWLELYPVSQTAFPGQKNFIKKGLFYFGYQCQC